MLLTYCCKIRLKVVSISFFFPSFKVQQTVKKLNVTESIINKIR